jgi:hypothetical protein
VRGCFVSIACRSGVRRYRNGAGFLLARWLDGLAPNGRDGGLLVRIGLVEHHSFRLLVLDKGVDRRFEGLKSVLLEFLAALLGEFGVARGGGSDLTRNFWRCSVEV